MESRSLLVGHGDNNPIGGFNEGFEAHSSFIGEKNLQGIPCPCSKRQSKKSKNIFIPQCKIQTIRICLMFEQNEATGPLEKEVGQPLELVVGRLGSWQQEQAGVSLLPSLPLLLLLLLLLLQGHTSCLHPLPSNRYPISFASFSECPSV